MTTHILVATDGSEKSRGAVRFGSTLARGLAGRLTLVHVVHPSEDPGNAEAILRSAQEVAAKWGVEGTIRVERGNPVEAIVGLRREIGADLLVVGTHGRRGVARVLLGSVAESLYRRASCPVAVVSRFDQPPEGIGPFLVPTDFSAGATYAARAAAVLVRKLRLRLVLLHVLHEASPPTGERDREAMRREAQKLRRDAEMRLRSLGETLALDAERLDIALVTGVVAPGIANMAEDIDAGCIVMGTRGLSGLPRVLLGNVTDEVLRQAPCPVLVVPPGTAWGGEWLENDPKSNEGVRSS